MMSARLFRVILPVTDIEQATEFYATVLGERGTRVSAGRHYFNCGGTILACFDPQADGDGYAAAPNPEWLYFAVDDVEATFVACRRAGAAFSAEDVHGQPAGEIHTRPWGEKSFYVIDPFGNRLCFVDGKSVYTGAAGPT